ncbi:MAG: hypothetical protein ACPG7F_07195 [Aggregatilineales bacterium]
MILQIELTDDEMHSLECSAIAQGFKSTEAYVKAIVLEPTKEELLEDIRQSILAAERGDKMLTIAEMWAEVERDDDPDDEDTDETEE